MNRLMSACCVVVVIGCASSTMTAPSGAGGDTRAPAILFDDFTYGSTDEMGRNGWILRTAAGWPGVPGASWGKERMSLLDDPSRPGNRLIRMTSSTDGTPAKTYQSQFCHERKYFEGTYAARVRFTDAPLSGPNGDQLVETFYMISPLRAPMDLNYSELDYEYLPNGGWGTPGSTMWATTWETFHPEPEWKADNESAKKQGSHAGWKTLMLQVSGDRARYYVDGNLLADHGGRFFPEEPMSINFNLWFIRDGLLPAGSTRTWVEDIDWVFHEKGSVLNTAEVEERVADLRRRGVPFRDTVPAMNPRLASPCDF
jgi:hypothetical protein